MVIFFLFYAVSFCCYDAIANTIYNIFFKYTFMYVTSILILSIILSKIYIKLINRLWYKMNKEVSLNTYAAVAAGSEQPNMHMNTNTIQIPLSPHNVNSATVTPMTADRLLSFWQRFKVAYRRAWLESDPQRQQQQQDKAKLSTTVQLTTK